MDFILTLVNSVHFLLALAGAIMSFYLWSIQSSALFTPSSFGIREYRYAACLPGLRLRCGAW